MQDASKLTFEEYAKKWILIEKNRMLRNTWEEYSRALRTHIIPAMGHLLLKEVNAYHINDYISIKLANGRLNVKGGLNPNTVRKHLAYISVVLESATEKNNMLIPYNPARLVKWKKIKQSRKENLRDSNNSAVTNCYSAQELNMLLSLLERLYSYRRLPKKEKLKDENVAALKKLGFTDEEIKSSLALFKAKTVILYPFVYIASRTGMRRSEILALQWDDIDYNQKVIKVHSSIHYGTKEIYEDKGYFFNTTKEGKPKSYIKITDKDMAFLKQLRKEQMKERRKFEKRNPGKYHDKNLVFCQRNGLPLWGDNIADTLKEFIESNNLKPITLHGFRHTHCTLLILAGVDDAYVAQRLGHQDPAFSRRKYVHVPRGNTPNIGDIFEKLLENGEEFDDKLTLAERIDAEKKAELILDKIGG